MNVLHIDSSILGEASASRVLTRAIIAKLGATQPALRVNYHDLAAEPLTHYSLASVMGSNPAESARDAATLEAFLAADVIVVGAPLYNFGLPSQLKAWIDRISIKGKTFRYTANGPEGLAAGKKVIVAIARGGLYQPGAGTEFGESYLTVLFGFLGVKEVSFVRAEGLNVSAEQREASLRAARGQIRTLPSPARAALAA
jgi:FMN-dependent NADH-azoreductase